MAREQLEAELALVPGYDAYFAYARHRVNYSGVVTFVGSAWCKQIQSAFDRFSVPDCPNEDEEEEEHKKSLRQLEDQGRIMIVDMGLFVLINVYVPFAADAERYIAQQHFCKGLQQCITYWLMAGRQLCVVGDLNIAPTRLDHCDPAGWEQQRQPPCTFEAHPPRHWLSTLTGPQGVLVDALRHYHPMTQGLYTCWNAKMNAR
jgi:AP endonuclease-2